MAIKKIKLPGMAQPVDIGTTWTNVSDKPDLITSEEATAYMQKGVDYVTAGQDLESTLGLQATAEGNETAASGDYSHTEGQYTMAEGESSHAEGQYTMAEGESSHAEGNETTAHGNYSHAEGLATTANGNYSHAEGNGTTANGESSHAEGEGTIASGQYSHAEGFNTTASEDYSHAEGYDTTADGEYSHAEGHNTTTYGNASHAEGNGTTASSVGSHAEGYNTTASGIISHAEGNTTVASGTSSHAEGDNTIANHRSQHVFGEYNIVDNSPGVNRGNYVEIVGNGNSNARSNARTLDWNGNEVLAGKLTVGAAPTENMDVTTKQYVDNIVTTNANAALLKTGGAMSGDIAMGNHKITNLADGEVVTDAATVGQLISLIQHQTTTIETSATSAVINLGSTYTCINAYATIGNERVLVDIEVNEASGIVTFSTAQEPPSTITCHVFYFLSVLPTTTTIPDPSGGEIIVGD